MSDPEMCVAGETSRIDHSVQAIYHKRGKSEWIMPVNVAKNEKPRERRTCPGV